MATGSYLPIINLNVNGWKPQPKNKDWMNGYKNKTLYMLSTRDKPLNKGHIQTKSEGLAKDIPCK